MDPIFRPACKEGKCEPDEDRLIYSCIKGFVESIFIVSDVYNNEREGDNSI
jgi:hypothetical protein